MKRTLHRLAHLLGVNHGRPAFLKKDGRYYRCFRCECGAVQCVREMSYAEAVAWARDYCDRWEMGPATIERPGRR